MNFTKIAKNLIEFRWQWTNAFSLIKTEFLVIKTGNWFIRTRNSASFNQNVFSSFIVKLFQSKVFFFIYDLNNLLLSKTICHSYDVSSLEVREFKRSLWLTEKRNVTFGNCSRKIIKINYISNIVHSIIPYYFFSEIKYIKDTNFIFK